MAEFAYKNNINLNTGHILFESNYGYYSYVFYKEDIDPFSKLKLINKLLMKF